MLPLSDENPRRRFPVLTVSLIALNTVVFFLQVGAPGGLKASIDEFALVPMQLTEAPMTHYASLFSSMFMHGGLAHLAGNMLYLWIFGDNIEDRLGYFKYILFYLLCGVLAAFSHIATAPHSAIPTVGASGAISGVLGGYLVLFPSARVKTLIFLGYYITVVRIPAVVLLGIWILLQVLNSASADAGGSGVAWLAHIGGFVAGAVLIRPFLAIRL